MMMAGFHLLLFLFSVLLTLRCDARRLRLAFAFDGETWDFGWTFHTNLARIALMETLADRYPGIDISHDYAFFPQTDTEDCQPQFEAWLRAGVDIIISAAVAQELCLIRLAAAYPNATFLSAATSAVGPANYANVFVRLHQPLYLAGYTAGLMTKTKKVCTLSPPTFPQSLVDMTAFCRGVHNADPSVEVHVLGSSSPRYPLLEVWIVNQSYALGCDVVWVQTVAIDGTLHAQQLGLMAIGFFTDARKTVGESVITSAMINLAPAYLRAVQAALNGTLWQETQKADWWMGWNWGAMQLADFSFLVPRAVQAKVLAQVPTLDRIFCGRVCTKTRCICNNASCCLTDSQKLSFDSFPDFVRDHGVMQLPGLACRAGQLATWHLDTFTMTCSDCPAGTFAYNADEVSECRPCPTTTYSSAGSAACTACPPGTYGDRPGLGRCTPCAAGTFTADPSAVRCTPCPSGLSSLDGTQCEPVRLTWVAGVGGGVGGGLLAVGLLLLWLTRASSWRNNRAAPKNAAQPFSVVFTDIQGSTGLWAAIPDVMAHALDAHHAIIRRLIARHDCYEVKTIGDSFMCAAKSPAQALRFALAIQEEFVQHDWGTDRIDRVYAELAAGTPETPADCWKGLRIRVGIHYGHGDIRLDPVSRGYDYYGTVVNTAARIESVCHGGQVGVSEAVFAALGGHFPHAVFTDLGPQPLRGLLEPLRLYQVLPEGPLSQRSFPPLRVDRVEEAEDLVPPVTQWGTSQRVYPESVCSSLGPGTSWVENHALVVRGDITAAELQRHYHTLQVGLSTLLSPLGSAPKQRVVRRLCGHMHVPNHGIEGPRLLHTLHGLIKRVLPATVVQGHGLEKESSQFVSDPGARRFTLRSVV